MVTDELTDRLTQALEDMDRIAANLSGMKNLSVADYNRARYAALALAAKASAIASDAARICSSLQAIAGPSPRAGIEDAFLRRRGPDAALRADRPSLPYVRQPDAAVLIRAHDPIARQTLGSDVALVGRLKQLALN